MNETEKDQNQQEEGRKLAEEQKEAAQEAPKNFFMQLIETSFTVVSSYFKSVKERVDASQEAQNPRGGIANLPKIPLLGIQMLADILGGYEKYKDSTPEQPRIVAHTGLGSRDALIENPDAIRQQKEAEMLGNLSPSSTPSAVRESPSRDVASRSLPIA